MSVLDDSRKFPPPRRLELEIGWRTILRVLLGLLLAYGAILLWPIVKMLAIASLFAVALHPIVAWVKRQGGPAWLGLLLASATLITIILGIAAVIAPMALQELNLLGTNLPRIREQMMAHLSSSGVLRQALETGMSPGTVADSRLVLGRVLLLLETTVGGIVYFAVVVALAVYLLGEGSRAVQWLVAFLPAGERDKVFETLAQISGLVSAYVVGQFTVCLFCATYLFFVLSFLGVPMALLVAVFAGICDIVPVLGFVLAAALAMVMGLTISPGTSGLIFVLYGAYHLFENLLIVPRVYGRKLHISKLTVPLAIAGGGLVAGVVGAIVVLPIVAAYPVVERLWLAPRLKPHTVKAHEALVP